ncbi:MAG: class I SAM-dependent methyltransferase [Acidobacteriota bacterium]
MTNSPRDLAALLRRPSGPAAEAAADRMNTANERTNLEAIDALGIVADDRVLEIGPGNGTFAATMIERAPGVSYVGLDWAEEVVAIARKRNRTLIEAGQARFEVGTSSQIPFDDGSFDKALAVHTIYFWDDPRAHLSELKRVLAPGGKLCLGFGDRSFMADLPFTAYGFNLYDHVTVLEHLRATGFSSFDIRQHVERGQSNTGAVVDKLVNILVCTA